MVITCSVSYFAINTSRFFFFLISKNKVTVLEGSNHEMSLFLSRKVSVRRVGIV